MKCQTKDDLLRAAVTTSPAQPASTVVELKHGAPRRIGEPRNGRFCIFHPWRLNSYVELLEWQRDELIRMLGRTATADWDLVALSVTAIPVATLVAQMLRKRLVVCDNVTNLFLPEHPSEQVVLFDALIQTGHHMKLAELRLGEHDRVVGRMCVALNDYSGKLEFLKSLIENDSLIHLFSLTEAYESWVARPEPVRE